MKHIKIVLGLFMSIIALGMQAQEFPIMTFEKTTHDFGTIHEKDVVETTFKFKNTGNAPLIITKIKASCGCTVPSNYDKTPIPPGGESQFTVKFNSRNKPNKQHKRVTITCNTEKGREYVNITANVIPDPELEKIRQERYKVMKEKREAAKKAREAEAKAEEAKKGANEVKEQAKEVKKVEKPVLKNKPISLKEAKEKQKDAKATEKQLKEELKEAKKAEKDAKAIEKKAKKIKALNTKISKANAKIAKLKSDVEKYQKKLSKLK